MGIIPEGAPDSFADFVEPHKGDRNLLIRFVLEFLAFFISMWLVGYGVDSFHMLVQALCELVTSLSLLLQWRLDHATTHYVRAGASFLTVPSFIHLSVCGRHWPGEECDSAAWSSKIGRPYRIMMALAALRMLMNGGSLCLQTLFPDRGVTPNYGQEQLFFRAIIRFAGIPLYAAVTLQSLSDLAGTKWELPPIELVSNSIRCIVILPILSGALAHQWRHSGIDTEPRCNPQGSSGVTATRSQQLKAGEYTSATSKTASLTSNSADKPGATGNGTAATEPATIAPAAGTGDPFVVVAHEGPSARVVGKEGT